VVQGEAAVSRQQHGKHISAAMNKHAKIEELMEVVHFIQSV
jgi:hypothetical protein